MPDKSLNKFRLPFVVSLLLVGYIYHFWRDHSEFYIQSGLSIPGCCDRLAQYENKGIIGDILQYAKDEESHRKMVAIKLIEGIRRNESLQITSTIIEVEDIDDREKEVQYLFQRYEDWWNSLAPLPGKLKINPLQFTAYQWIGP